MMSWIFQSAIFIMIAVVCAVSTRFIAGEYDRSVACDPTALASYEVCMSTVEEEWGGEVLWIDARGRKEGKKLIKGALEISETHLNDDLATSAQAIFQANNNSVKVVVLCETDACGSSKYVRSKILENSQ